MNPLSPAKSERAELRGQAFRAFRYLLASLRANNTFWNKLAVTSDRSQTTAFLISPPLRFFFLFLFFLLRNLIKLLQGYFYLAYMFQVYNCRMFGVEIDPAKLRVRDKIERGGAPSHDRCRRVTGGKVKIHLVLKAINNN